MRNKSMVRIEKRLSLFAWTTVLENCVWFIVHVQKRLLAIDEPMTQQKMLVANEADCICNSVVQSRWESFLLITLYICWAILWGLETDNMGKYVHVFFSSLPFPSIRIRIHRIQYMRKEKNHDFVSLFQKWEHACTCFAARKWKWVIPFVGRGFSQHGRLKQAALQSGKHMCITHLHVQWLLFIFSFIIYTCNKYHYLSSYGPQNGGTTIQINQKVINFRINKSKLTAKTITPKELSNECRHFHLEWEKVTAHTYVLSNSKSNKKVVKKSREPKTEPSNCWKYFPFISLP